LIFLGSGRKASSKLKMPFIEHPVECLRLAWLRCCPEGDYHVRHDRGWLPLAGRNSGIQVS
jgi:hypothetical protein